MVIAIIGVLAAIAIPTYRSYTIRTSILDVLAFLEKQANAEKVHYSKVGVWGNFGSNVTDNTDTPNPEPSIPRITHFQRHYNAAGNWRMYLAARFNINSVATVGGVTTGYLAFVCSETNGVVNCECRTAMAGSSEEIRSEYLPPKCRCNVAWSATCPQ